MGKEIHKFHRLNLNSISASIMYRIIRTILVIIHLCFIFTHMILNTLSDYVQDFSFSC